MVQKSSRLKTASHIMFFEMFLGRKFLSFIKFVVESIHVRLPFPNNVQLKGNCQMKIALVIQGVLFHILMMVVFYILTAAS